MSLIKKKKEGEYIPSPPIEQWKCPCCKSPVKITGSFTAEDVAGGSFTTERVECSFDDCATHRIGLFWDYNGDTYSSPSEVSSYHYTEKICIGKNDAPFGSLSRKLNVEIYGKGVDKGRWIKFWITDKYQLKVEFKYKSNYDGDILGRRTNYQWLKKDDRPGYVHVDMMPFGTWKFLWRKAKRGVKSYRESTSQKSELQALDRMFKPSMNRKWKYRAFESFLAARFFVLNRKRDVLTNDLCG